MGFPEPLMRSNDLSRDLWAGRAGAGWRWLRDSRGAVGDNRYLHLACGTHRISSVLRLAAVYGQCGRIWESYPSLRPKATNCSHGSSRAAAVDEKPLKFDGRSGGCFT